MAREGKVPGHVGSLFILLICSWFRMGRGCFYYRIVGWCFSSRLCSCGFCCVGGVHKEGGLFPGCIVVGFVLTKDYI